MGSGGGENLNAPLRLQHPQQVMLELYFSASLLDS
jgi:hypothetical protein